MRVGDTFGGAEDAKELVALTANAAEETELLENHGPRYDGENRKDEQNPARDPARLSKDVTEISDENRGDQKNDATPQLVMKFPYFKNVTHAHRVVKTNQMRKERRMLSFWNGDLLHGPRIRHKVRLHNVRVTNLPGNGGWPVSFIARLDAKG